MASRHGGVGAKRRAGRRSAGALLVLPKKARVHGHVDVPLLFASSPVAHQSSSPNGRLQPQRTRTRRRDTHAPRGIRDHTHTHTLSHAQTCPPSTRPASRDKIPSYSVRLASTDCAARPPGWPPCLHVRCNDAAQRVPLLSHAPTAQCVALVTRVCSASQPRLLAAPHALVAPARLLPRRRCCRRSTGRRGRPPRAAPGRSRSACS